MVLARFAPKLPGLVEAQLMRKSEPPAPLRRRRAGQRLVWAGVRPRSNLDTTGWLSARESLRKFTQNT